MLSERGRGASVLGRCPHGVGRNGDMNRAQGRIQMGQIGNEHRDAGDDCGAIKEALACNR